MTFPCPSYSGDPPANCETQNQPYEEASTQPAPTPDDDDSSDDDDSAELSLRTEDRTACPGTPDEWCWGRQCCPGTPASGGMTFPCPSYSGDPPANCETQNQPYEDATTQPAPTP